MTARTRRTSRPKKTRPLPRRIFVLGPQGSGKGTQAEILSKTFKLPALSMGELLRTEVRQKTAIGKKVQSLLDAGRLVPHKITDEIFARWLKTPKGKKGFIMDGYPRNTAQMHFILKATPIDMVIALDLSDRAAIQRLKGRVVCEKCGRIYHQIHKPSRYNTHCHVCGGLLIHRHDDTPSAIRTRLGLYHKETEPVIRALEKRGFVARIDAAPSIAHVAQQIRHAIKNWTPNYGTRHTAQR